MSQILWPLFGLYLIVVAFAMPTVIVLCIHVKQKDDIGPAMLGAFIWCTFGFIVLALLSAGGYLIWDSF